MPGAISIVISELTGPFTMSRIVPRNWLRALVFMTIAPPRMDHHRQRMRAVGRFVNMQELADSELEAWTRDRPCGQACRDRVRSRRRREAGERLDRVRGRKSARGDDRDR